MDHLQLQPSDRTTPSAAHELAQHAFSRAAGSPLIEGNAVRLLKDARENYPAWLDAIATASRHIHFENYIFYEDPVGYEFADALIAKARKGVRVRVIYDWLGGVGRTSGRFWQHLRLGGVDVRCYNPPRFDSPLGWSSRDHRKMLAVDSRVAFVTGLCVGQAWVGDAEKRIDPWRDTGVEVRGPAVADIVRAFAEVWAMTGAPLPDEETVKRETIARAGDTALRVVASVPNTAGMLRLDQLVAALARERLWLTDAYYAGTTAFAQALCTAATDGVDVRLLVPGATDIPLLRPLSRAGFRSLLEAGVRVFEWNGTMLHAKTATADGRWARVGSTNLNIASWLGNCELDVVVEDERFARGMEDMYLHDLANATEVVLKKERRRVARPVSSRVPRSSPAGASASAGRAATGVLRIGHAVGAAITNRRVLEPVESRIMTAAGILLLAASIGVAAFPQVVGYPVGVLAGWFAVVLILKGMKLFRQSRKRQTRVAPEVDRRSRDVT